MVRCKTAGARKGNGSAESVYTLEQLPDEKKKRYHSLLEDFDKQVTAHIEEARAEMEKMMKQIQNAYRVEIFKLPKDQKNLIQEELVLKNMEEKQKKDGKSIRESSIFQSNMAKVSESVDNLVTKEVAKVEKSAKKKGRGGVSTIKKSKPKRSFSEPAPPSTVRRSTRKRMPSERSILAMETPHAGPGMAKGPLTSTAYSNRIRGVGTRKGMLMETPCNPNYTSAFADVSHVLPAITPKCKNSKCNKVHKKCRRTCSYWSRKNKCLAKWTNIVSKTCRTRLGGARQKQVRQYCKKSCSNRGKLI